MQLMSKIGFNTARRQLTSCGGGRGGMGKWILATSTSMVASSSSDTSRSRLCFLNEFYKVWGQSFPWCLAGYYCWCDHGCAGERTTDYPSMFMQFRLQTYIAPNPLFLQYHQHQIEGRTSPASQVSVILFPWRLAGYYCRCNTQLDWGEDH